MAADGELTVVSVPFWDYTQDFSIINATAHALPRSHEAFGKIDYAQLWDLDVWGSDFFGAAASSPPPPPWPSSLRCWRTTATSG